MVKFTGIKPSETVKIVRKAIAKSAMIAYTRSMKEKLTYRYLGVQSGTLRNETNAIVSDMTVYPGTNPWYGHAYETGNWNRWKGKTSEKQKRWKRTRKATWSGDRKHRPFMRDTLTNPKTTVAISRRCNIELKKQLKGKV